MDAEENKKQPRISGKTAFWMIVVAVVMDFLGPIGTVIGGCIFAFWFYTLNVPLIGPKQLARWGLNFIAEGLTAGVWVGMTVGVILMITLTRAEDKLGVNILDKVGAKGVGKAASTTAVRTERKAARRALNPERTARAQERLERMRSARSAREQGGGAPAKSAPVMKDFTYKKAA